MSINVMLVDDHAMIREGLKHLLMLDKSITVIAEASNGKDCLKLLSSISPDIVLLDINLPDINGLEVLKNINTLGCSFKTLLLTVHNEVEYLLKAIEIGANGYILKDSGFEELKKAIHLIISGECYIQPSLIPALNSRLVTKNNDKNKIDQLTIRELEVLRQVANGKFNKEIAINLNITERTVKNHISNIFKKIDVCDRTQAAVFAIKNDLISII